MLHNLFSIRQFLLKKWSFLVCSTMRNDPYIHVSHDSILNLLGAFLYVFTQGYEDYSKFIYMISFKKNIQGLLITCTLKCLGFSRTKRMVSGKNAISCGV